MRCRACPPMKGPGRTSRTGAPSVPWRVAGCGVNASSVARFPQALLSRFAGIAPGVRPWCTARWTTRVRSVARPRESRQLPTLLVGATLPTATTCLPTGKGRYARSPALDAFFRRPSALGHCGLHWWTPFGNGPAFPPDGPWAVIGIPIPNTTTN